MTRKLHSKNEPEVAVIVLNYNGKHHLAECLRSLQILDYENYEVYVVDNGSTDSSIEYVRESFPWVKIIAFKENLGFSKAYNEAAEMVDAELVAVLNNDTRVEADWLKELVATILKDNSIMAVGSKILLYDNSQLLSHAGTKFSPIGGGFNIGLYKKDKEIYNVKKQVGAVCGASMLVRRNLFIRIGGFDEDFFAYFEDVDFCLRAWLYGFKIFYVPTSIAHHKLGGSFGSRASPFRVFLGERNRLMMIIKNFEIKNFVKAMVIYPIFVMTLIYLSLKNKHVRSIKSILEANIWILRNFRKVINKRRLLQGSRRISDRYLEENGLMATLKECIKEFREIKFT